MPDPLRLMTFNVQLLPVIAGVVAGTVSLPGSLVGLFPSGDSDAIARFGGGCGTRRDPTLGATSCHWPQ